VGPFLKFHVVFHNTPLLRVYSSAILSLLMHILRTTSPNFTQLSVSVVCGRGSGLLCGHCNTLCTSGLWMTSFCYSVPSGGVTLPQQPRCNFVHWLTPRLRVFWFPIVLDDGGRQVQTAWRAKNAGGEVCYAPLPCSTYVSFFGVGND